MARPEAALMTERAHVGMIHGRFQPFHNGHLDYLRGAAAQSDRLLVGITNPDRARTKAESPAPGRESDAANPFTYTERAEMITGVLRDEGLGDALAIPFPVSQPDLWPDYVPDDTVHFLRVYDAWGEVKRSRLQAAGYEVRVLDPGTQKSVSGAEVRRLLALGRDWDRLVPPATARVITPLLGPSAEDLRRPA
jgi:cytidyltransferase-like protein